MPLSEHEQRILEEIERRLSEEDPRLAESVARASVSGHAVRRIRWGIGAFVLGFVLLLLFQVSLWIALSGFVVMLAASLMVYHYLKKVGRDQLSSIQRSGRFSLTAVLARWAERLRRPRGTS
jgi:hypothetical protein